MLIFIVKDIEINIGIIIQIHALLFINTSWPSVSTSIKVLSDVVN
jgi:hypothetical protein